MSICIFGAGAIGSAIGGRLAAAGKDVVLLGRGEHARVMRERGLTLLSSGNEQTIPVKVAERAAELPVQDTVIVCLKAHAIAPAAEDIARLLGENSRVIFAINGIPWWYFHKSGGKYDERRLSAVDPEGRIWEKIGPERALGCVVYLAAKVEAPGRVQVLDNHEIALWLGEPDGSESAAAKSLTETLSKAGVPTELTADIRSQIWYKLWGNIAFNPVTALTHATQDAVVEHYHDTDLIEAIMNEARFVAEKVGIVFLEGPTSRIKKAASMRGHKTSMLQDIEQGRPTEIEAIVGAVREIGKWVGAETPHLNGLYSLMRLKERFYRPTEVTSGPAGSGQRNSPA